MVKKDESSPDLSAEQKRLFLKLSLIEQKLCLGLLSGMPRKEAYYCAGGRANSDASAYASASTMMAKQRVVEFMDSVMGAKLDKAIMNREEALKLLTVMARATAENVSPLDAIKELAKLEGWSVPTKHEVTGEVKHNHDHYHTVKSVQETDEWLERIISDGENSSSEKSVPH